jgi:Phytoene/squalene synthetase
MRFGADIEKPSQEFIELMRFEAARARAYYNESQPLLGMVHAKSRRSLWALIEIYSRLLSKIEASNYDVLSRRIGLSALEKSWVVAQAMLR